MKQRLAPACSRQSRVLGTLWRNVLRSSSSSMMRSGRMRRRSMCCSMPTDAGQPHTSRCSCSAPSVRTTWRAASRLPIGWAAWNGTCRSGVKPSPRSPLRRRYGWSSRSSVPVKAHRWMEARDNRKRMKASKHGANGFLLKPGDTPFFLSSTSNCSLTGRVCSTMRLERC